MNMPHLGPDVVWWPVKYLFLLEIGSLHLLWPVFQHFSTKINQKHNPVFLLIRKFVKKRVNTDIVLTRPNLTPEKTPTKPLVHLRFQGFLGVSFFKICVHSEFTLGLLLFAFGVNLCTEM